MAATGKRRFNFARTLGEHGMFLTSALLLYYFVPVDLSHPHPAIDFGALHGRPPGVSRCWKSVAR